ncbi:MAG: hypothetical protein JJ964_10245 [Rhizobiales bacterium]|nr:hypothetical protein [Hyphomicrobiales bacterium]
MRDIDKALIDIANIRGQLAAGTEFQGFGPTIITATGLLAGITMLLQLFFSETFSATNIELLIVWVFTAIISVIIIGIEMIARSRRHHKGLADAMLANAVEQFLPSGFAGAAIGAVLMKYSSQNIWMLPGIWQVCLALGIFAAVRSLPKTISIVGAWYFLSGTTVLLIGCITENLTPWMMGLPFLIGQLLMGFLLYIASEEQQDE